MEDKKNNEIEEVTMLIDPEEIELTPEKFEQGLDNISELAGQIAGLVMVGVPPVEALAYFAGIEQFEHEKYINKQTGEFSVEVAKINAEAQSKADAKVSTLLENRMM